MTHQDVLAHAFGARYELPIPLLLFVLGGAAVVLATFLFVLRREVRPKAAGEGDWQDEGRTQLQGAGPRVGGIVSVAVLCLLIWAGLAGSQVVAENILPTVFWLLVWIAVPVSCGVLGDWTVPVNPFGALARWADSARLRKGLLGGADPLAWPRWLGWWPAALLFAVLAWGELVVNSTATLPRVTAIGLAVYALVSALLGLVFGAESWLGRGEVFSTVLATWGRLGRWRFGAPGRPGFGGGLDVPIEATASRVVLVMLLLVSVAFDGLTATPLWARWQHELPRGYGLGTTGLTWLTTLAFVLLIGLFLLVFLAFAAAVRRAGRLPGGPLAALADLLPSLLPISFGYLLAHNIEYLVVNVQLLMPLLADPLGKGWHLLPKPFGDTYEVHAHVLPNAFYWYVSLVAIVLVHVIAVLVAHRHLERRASRPELARRSEWPWVVAMVGYTMLSLWLLAQPLVSEGK